MDRLHQIARLRRENRHTRNCAVVAFPDLSEPSHRERRSVLAIDAIRSFGATVLCLPLVKVRREDETRPRLLRLLEHTFLGCGLRTSIDDTFLSLVRDDLQLVVRHNVVSRRVPAVGDDLGVESCLEIGLANDEGIASAHTL